MFNLLMAREIQKSYGQEPQVVLTLPLLEGTDGVEKMSKSLGNYIGITDSPEDMFGKTMSIPDGLILKYFELVSSKAPKEIVEIEKRIKDPSTNPSHLKRELARDIVAQYHNEDAAGSAEAHFDRIHVKRDIPEDIDEVAFDGGSSGLWVVKALSDTGVCKSSSDARRMIKQGAVSIDGEKITDMNLNLEAGSVYTIKVGKRRFVRIRVN